MPPPAAPVPSPVPLDVETLEKERAQRRQRLRQFGRDGTILTTESGLGGKGTLLGGVA